ncbi:MAG TPA: ZIP family zinc transporter [Candidatus Limnocylindria bacterium]
MVAAGLWGLLGASSLVLGAVVGLRAPLARRWVALLMAFGSGALISALAYDLAQEAFSTGGTGALATGLAAGALTFFIGNTLIHRSGGHRRGGKVKSPDGNGPAIVLGALLDGIPESVVLGSTLLGGATISISFLAAVFISNVPESLSAAADLRREGHEAGWILRLWVLVALVSGVAAAAGYALLGAMGASVLVPFVQAFAAGAILTLLADTMIPEAFEEGGPLVGLATVFGFALAFLLSNAG